MACLLGGYEKPGEKFIYCLASVQLPKIVFGAFVWFEQGPLLCFYIWGLLSVSYCKEKKKECLLGSYSKREHWWTLVTFVRRQQVITLRSLFKYIFMSRKWKVTGNQCETYDTNKWVIYIRGTLTVPKGPFTFLTNGSTLQNTSPHKTGSLLVTWLFTGTECLTDQLEGGQLYFASWLQRVSVSLWQGTRGAVWFMVTGMCTGGSSHLSRPGSRVDLKPQSTLERSKPSISNPLPPAGPLPPKVPWPPKIAPAAGATSIQNMRLYRHMRC